MPTDADPRPLHPRPPPRRHRRGLWALPLLLSALFVAGFLVWAERNDRGEHEEARRTMISDALSAEAQLRGRLEVEAARLRTVAEHLAVAPRTQAALADDAEVRAGFQRLWISVTWLDASNRIVAHAPEQAALPRPVDQSADMAAGVSSHLVATVPRHADAVARAEAGSDPRSLDFGGERVVLRYSPAVLLERSVPWWLKRRYAVRLVDDSDQVIASVDERAVGDKAVGDARGRDSYRVAVGAGLPGAYLELVQREAPPDWWRSLPWPLILGFLALIGLASGLLRRQMRQVLRAEVAWRTEASWRTAMGESALVGLRARDGDGRVLYVNRTFCQMVGLSATELIGRAPPMPYWPPDAVDEAMERSRRNLAGGAPREGYETRWRHADGHLIDVMVFESPLVDAVGRQVGWMGSIVEVTAVKQAQERERRQTEAMAHQARLTTLGEVASALAHQLNQPLAAIAGYNAGVQRTLERAGFADPLVMGAVQRLGEQAAEAGRIVQRIRAFLTRRAPQRERVDLHGVVRDALKLLGADARRRLPGVQLDAVLPPALPPVLADPVLIEQVLINLVRNALDAMAEAPRRGETAPAVRVTVSRAGDRFLRVDVDDNGPGLGGRTIDVLTAPFYSTKADGMGMGLAICRSVVEAHFGGMEAEASPLGGARLAFTLPIDVDGDDGDDDNEGAHGEAAHAEGDSSR